MLTYESAQNFKLTQPIELKEERLRAQDQEFLDVPQAALSHF
jgi:hypothetical protein